MRSTAVGLPTDPARPNSFRDPFNVEAETIKDLADVAHKLAAQPWERHTITSVEHSRAQDFPFVEQITADLFMAAFDWVEWMRHVPPFLRVCVTVEAAPGSHFEFEVWLPVGDWNGRVVTIGNGGPAMGLIPPGLIAATRGSPRGNPRESRNRPGPRPRCRHTRPSAPSVTGRGDTTIGPPRPLEPGKTQWCDTGIEPVTPSV
jgi:hypothetical protein